MPSAENTEATMPAASSPASAYITFGLFCSMKRSGKVSVRTFKPAVEQTFARERLKNLRAETSC